MSTPTTPYSDLVIPFMLSGIGMALFFAPVANVVLSTVRRQEEGQASGANNAIRELGGVFGVAVLASIFARVGGYETAESFVDGMVPAVYVGAALVAVGSGRGADDPRPRAGQPPAARVRGRLALDPVPPGWEARRLPAGIGAPVLPAGRERPLLDEPSGVGASAAASSSAVSTPLASPSSSSSSSSSSQPRPGSRRGRARCRRSRSRPREGAAAARSSRTTREASSLRPR